MKDFPITLATATQYRADTGGWDAVNCVRITEINDAIRNAGTSPGRMEFAPDADSSVSGAFDSWRVSPGGDGPLINLEIPMRDVTVARGDRQATLDHIVIEIQVRMELIPSGRNAPQGGGITEKLLVIAKRPSPLLLGADGSERAATLVGHTGLDDLGLRLKSTLLSGVETWMNDNLDSFTHVFAAVNVSDRMSEETEGEAFAWLKPTDVSYAFGASGTDPDASVLAILCQTEGRSRSGLVHQADPGLIPEGCDAGVVISRSRFLRNMVGKSLPRAFKGLSGKDIRYKEKDTGLHLAKPVKAQKVEHDGKTYAPVIHQLDVSLRDTEMELKSLTKTEVSPGIFSVCSATAAYAFGLTKRSDGAKTIGFVETRPIKTVESTEKTKEVTILDTILTILGVIGGLVITFVSFGTASVAYYVVLGIVLGSLAGTISIKLIEMTKEGDAPPIDLLMANATGAVRWSTGRTFDPTFAALNNGLQIGGRFVKADTGLLGVAPDAGPVFHGAFQSEFADIMKERKDQ